jgi:hypothetical protein
MREEVPPPHPLDAVAINAHPKLSHLRTVGATPPSVSSHIQSIPKQACIRRDYVVVLRTGS